MDYSQYFDKNNLRNYTPWYIIKESAKQQDIKIQNPNPHCKHCFGKGYTGIKHDTGEPIPCKCIFPKETIERMKKIDEDIGDVSEYRKKNRAERRKNKK